MTGLAENAAAIAAGLASFWLISRLERQHRCRACLWYWGIYVLLSVGFGFWYSWQHGIWQAALQALFAGLFYFMWLTHWRHRRRDRAKGWAGYKAKALIAGLVRRQREAQVPARCAAILLAGLLALAGCTLRHVPDKMGPPSPLPSRASLVPVPGLPDGSPPPAPGFPARQHLRSGRSTPPDPLRPAAVSHPAKTS